MTIAGDWYNEFGSHMRLTDDTSGGLTGTYVSGAGHVAGPYELTGRHDAPAGPGRGTAVGWTVAWRNEQGDAGSVTSWSGQYLAGDETILATWLLTRSASAADVWESTVVGQDVFTRQAPAPEDVERHLRGRRPASHPS
ncbi:avidin/streptavidin family protein [Kitasatospora sp. NPDC085895]|uniref:avidin/streptavidin family protein n=1 Tax=Kitasatospora sp. NPDC085895 TaxID=3155057 RepID=UPI00344F2A28